MVTRSEVVAAARDWVGTRFQHQGRIKKTATHKGGCDCLGLLIGVAKELQLPGQEQNTLLCDYDVVHYSLTPDSKKLEQALKQYTQQIPVHALAPGDIALFNCDNSPQHLAMISDYSRNECGMIHAYAPARKVVEHHFDNEWKKRLVSAFRLRLGN